jgi:NitT/TauT family transport system substrate-binding protein
MLPLHAALVKGLFAEEGLRVDGANTQTRAAVEQGKTHSLWVKTESGITEADFGFIQTDILPNLAAGKVDYYIVDGMHFGCQEVMVAVDSPMKSAADLKDRTVALAPAWVEPYHPAAGPTFFNSELRSTGLDPAKDVKRTHIPWEALPKLNDFVADGFKSGKFDAIVVGEPQNLMLREKKLARPLFTQTYQAPYNQEYCCLFGIKRSLVDAQPEKAAIILRAFRRAKQWVAENPTRAVVASQAAGYYPAALPVGPSASAAASFGFDRVVDLETMLEGAFQQQIDWGAITSGTTAKQLVRQHYRKLQ